MTNTRREKTLKMVQLSVLTAILFIMAFTPLGYFHAIPGAPPITLLPIPVIIGAVVLGPASGAFLGAIFGLTSLIMCFGMDPFGTTLFGINPFFTAVLCFIPRMLMGLIVGLVFKGLQKLFEKSENRAVKGLSYPIACIIGAPLNTVLFIVGLVAFFGNSDLIGGMISASGNKILTFAVAFVGLNGIVEAIACFVLATAAAIALNAFLNRSKQKN